MQKFRICFIGSVTRESQRGGKGGYANTFWGVRLGGFADNPFDGGPTGTPHLTLDERKVLAQMRAGGRNRTPIGHGSAGPPVPSVPFGEEIQVRAGGAAEPRRGLPAARHPPDRSRPLQKVPILGRIPRASPWPSLAVTARRWPRDTAAEPRGHTTRRSGWRTGQVLRRSGSATRCGCGRRSWRALGPRPK